MKLVKEGVSAVISSHTVPQPIPPRMAFGVDPSRRERFSLRQGRYDAIGEELAQRGRVALQAGRRLKVLDIGAGQGLTLRYLEGRDGAAGIELSGVDIVRYDTLYRPSEWKDFWVSNLMQGLPPVPSETYDIVICEQIFEHLSELELGMATINRVLRPGGIAIVGVPIFPSGVNKIRELIVPWIDGAKPPKTPRGHVQSFSKRSFLKLFQQHSGLTIEKCFGFRIVSGGLLRQLENHEWWYRLNRSVGRIVPSLCTEIQIIARKPVVNMVLPTLSTLNHNPATVVRV